MTFTYTAPTRPIMQDVTIMSCTPYNGSTAGSPLDYIGVIETVEINLKREYVETQASSDTAKYKRVSSWAEGSVKMTGFSGATASQFAKLFAAGSHAVLQLTETATGDSYQLLVRTEEFSKSMGKEANKDTLSMPQEGTPFYATANGTLAAIPLG